MRYYTGRKKFCNKDCLFDAKLFDFDVKSQAPFFLKVLFFSNLPKKISLSEKKPHLVASSLSTLCLWHPTIDIFLLFLIKISIWRRRLLGTINLKTCVCKHYAFLLLLPYLNRNVAYNNLKRNSFITESGFRGIIH